MVNGMKNHIFVPWKPLHSDGRGGVCPWASSDKYNQWLTFHWGMEIMLGLTFCFLITDLCDLTPFTSCCYSWNVYVYINNILCTMPVAVPIFWGEILNIMVLLLIPTIVFDFSLQYQFPTAITLTCGVFVFFSLIFSCAWSVFFLFVFCFHSNYLNPENKWLWPLSADVFEWWTCLWINKHHWRYLLCYSHVFRWLCNTVRTMTNLHMSHFQDPQCDKWKWEVTREGRLLKK